MRTFTCRSHFTYLRCHPSVVAVELDLSKPHGLEETAEREAGTVRCKQRAERDDSLLLANAHSISHMPFATSHTTTDPIQYQHIHIALCLWTLYTSTDITASPRARTDAATHRLPAFSGLVPACIPPPRHDLSTTYHTRPCRILHIRSYSTFLLRHLFALSWPFDAALASPAEPSVRLRLARREDTSARERIKHKHWSVNAYTNPPRLETPWQ